MKTDPFHSGELRAQHLAGQVALGHGIRDFMPDQHRLFFEALPFVLLASTAADGAPQAQVLHGAPGFIRSPDPLTLEIACDSDLAAGAPVGLLGIDFATRRRNRANGVVRSNAGGTLVVEVRESFGNCPKYITVREVETAPHQLQPARAFAGLDAAARALVAASDTFFVATSGGVHGLDISHRGGPAGFAHIDGDALVIPDFSGNRYFNTLGNMLLDARAALLFINFTTGDALTLQGTVAVRLQEDVREWRFRCADGVLARGAIPLRWR
jgi:predicted pyridoxine 5'-phosphate oxidase superfamily flavin-nucleotide-binding protein